ncbi:MAG: lysine--tRNA ligase [Patescibacteria group bacterium]|jgi:lysyl-tRNA synthetase class 2
MSRLEEEIKFRQEKTRQVKKNGINPYPAKAQRSSTIHELLLNFNKLEMSGEEFGIVGRIKSIRGHGGSTFMHIADGTDSMQVYYKKDVVGQQSYEQMSNFLDIGDFISASGNLFKTKKGEKTLQIKTFALISKSLRPLPEKWHGLSDVEIRYRQRYLDLIVNPSVKNNFSLRSKIIKTLRSLLENAGFLEVETPILQTIPGGANAEPFKTHHNSLDCDLYLRIAPELYLKRLIIGGFEKVFEIARCFRNEGIDRNHNPEFTQVEFYAAYWDYIKLMNFTEKLLFDLLTEVFGSPEIEFEKNKINFTPPFQKLNFKEACKKFAEIDIEKDELTKFVKNKKLDVPANSSRPKMLDEIFKALILPNLVQPTFITDYPIELSPLAKRKENENGYVERFQLVAAGKELCNAFSELNDPADQKERFLDQEKLRKQGDHEAQRIDLEYIEALEYGMPPTAGIGIGIDRLVALLTGSHSIKEIILFPTLKPKK